MITELQEQASFIRLYNQTHRDYCFIWKTEMGSITHNPSSLSNLTTTVTGSYMDLLLLSALNFAAF